MQQSDCVRNNWIVGAIFGLVVLLFVSGIGSLHWLAGLFLGAVTCLLLGGLLVWLNSGSLPEPFDDDAGLIEAAEARAEAERAASQPVAKVASVETVTEAAQEPVKAAPEAEKPVAAAPAPQKAAEQKPVQKPAPTKAAPKRSAKAKRDDLTKITGIGPKTAELLYAQGVTRFADIAAWDGASVADHAARLGRLGARIEADDWTGQARKLAEGADG